MGSGKTYWGEKLAQKLGLLFFDLDRQIEEKEGKSTNDIFREQGEEHFRLLEKDVLHLLAESHESFVMACGGGTPCYYNNIAYMKKKGSVYWLNCSVDCLYDRLVKDKEKRPLIRDLTNEQLHSFIVKKFADRKIYYEQATAKITDDNLTLERLVDRVFHS